MRRVYRPWMLRLLAIVFFANGIPVMVLGRPRLGAVVCGGIEIAFAFFLLYVASGSPSDHKESQS
jgi:hypothetical protein